MKIWGSRSGNFIDGFSILKRFILRLLPSIRVFCFGLALVAFAHSPVGAAGPIAKKALRASKLMKSIPGGSTILIEGGSYLLSPEETNWRSIADDSLESITLGNETADCDTVRCQQFMKQCQENLGLPKESSADDVQEDSKFKMCVRDFFLPSPDPQMKSVLTDRCRKKPTYGNPKEEMLGCPLDVQSRLREDGNLDRVLSEVSPYIRRLSCSGSVAQVEINQKQDKVARQDVNFNSKGEVANVTSEPNAQGGFDRVVYKNGRADLLQHCDGRSNCKNFPMQQVQSAKLYFWKSDRVHKAFGSDGGVPRDSFEWARSVEKLTDFQAAGIHNCCGDQKCQSFFSQRGQPLQSVQANSSSRGSK